MVLMETFALRRLWRDSNDEDQVVHRYKPEETDHHARG